MSTLTPDAPGRDRGSEPDGRGATAGSLTATWVLAASSLLALWLVFFAVILSSLQEAHAQHNAYAQFRQQLAEQVAPLGGLITPGDPVALLTARSLGIDSVVVIEGTASGDLSKGPGHKRNSPLPGQPGVAVIYGRATLFGGPFDHLDHGHAGDNITVTTGQGVFHYVVEDLRRVGDHYPPPLAADAGGLTLVTSEGASVGNLWQPKQPLYVDARLVGKTVPAPNGGLGAVPADEEVMRGDVGALFPLVLWIPLLVIAGLLVAWSAARWGRWQTWLIGAPLIFAALWGATATAVQLMPNLM